MTGRRRAYDAVIARPVVRAVTAAVVLLALGNLITIGCFVGWLRMLDPASPFRSGLWLMLAAAGSQLTAGTVALFAWAWSK